MPIFMKITGTDGVPISGAGVFPEHKDWMHLESFKFGKGASGSMAAKEDKTGEAPAAEPEKKKPEKKENSSEEIGVQYFGSTVTVDRTLDLASPSMMKWLSKGDNRTVEINQCNQAGENLFILILVNARLTEYEIGNITPDGIPETLTIAWDSFEILTAEIGADGKPKMS